MNTSIEKNVSEADKIKELGDEELSSSVCLSSLTHKQTNLPLVKRIDKKKLRRFSIFIFL